MAPKDVVPYLTNAEEGSVLFIDEIHRLPKAVEEFLYPAMEDFRIDITLGEGVNARTINMPLKPFTLIKLYKRASSCISLTTRGMYGRTLLEVEVKGAAPRSSALL